MLRLCGALFARCCTTGNCLISPTTLETLSTRYYQKAWDKSVK
jgi:hypothetical protein